MPTISPSIAVSSGIAARALTIAGYLRLKVLFILRAKVNLAVRLERNRSVAVELLVVLPLSALGKLVRAQQQHRFYEPGFGFSRIRHHVSHVKFDQCRYDAVVDQSLNGRLREYRPLEDQLYWAR